MDDVASDTGAGLDIESASESIGRDLFPDAYADKADPEPVSEAPDETDAPAPVVEGEPAPVVEARKPPKSWGTDYHGSWGTIDAKTQDYIERREQQMHEGLSQYKTDATYGKTLRDVMDTYRPILAAGGMDETQAVQTLLNAHYRLTQGDPQSRKQAFYELGQNLGFLQAQGAPPMDPQVQALQQQVQLMQQGLQAREQQTYNETREKIVKDVEAFAADPAHDLFDEAAVDIIAQIQSGVPLQEAYDKAVWANAVTRQKQIAKLQTEQTAKLRDEAKQNAAKARQAVGVNMRGRESRQAPTEPVGSMEETMMKVLADIKSRN